MLLRLQKYDLALKFVKGKYLHVADTLSRALCDDLPCEDLGSSEIEAVVHVLFDQFQNQE